MNAPEVVPGRGLEIEAEGIIPVDNFYAQARPDATQNLLTASNEQEEKLPASDRRTHRQRRILFLLVGILLLVAIGVGGGLGGSVAVKNAQK